MTLQLSFQERRNVISWNFYSKYFIKNMPVDPKFLQTQGLEHCHKWRKRVHLRSSNLKKPGCEGRSRTPQAMLFISLLDTLEMEFLKMGVWEKDTVRYKVKLEKRALRKIARFAKNKAAANDDADDEESEGSDSD